MNTETSHSYRNANATHYDDQAEKFLADNSIKFRATLSDSKPAPWGDNEKPRHHYRVTLSKSFAQSRFKTSRPSVRLTFDFWGSINDAEKGIETVKPYDVLACISWDVNCPVTFEDYCGKFGCEPDSIKALQSFRRCSGFGKRLRAFFTEAELEQLREIQ